MADLLTKAETCELLRISGRTLDRWRSMWQGRRLIPVGKIEVCKCARFRRARGCSRRPACSSPDKLGVSRSLLYKALADGKLAGYRIGCRGWGCWRVSEYDLTQWLETFKVSERPTARRVLVRHHKGQKVKLATDKAERAFHTLKATDTLPEAIEAETGPRPSLNHLVGLDLDQAKLTKQPETDEVQRRYLVGFCQFVGNRKAPDVRVTHVKDGVAADKRWRVGRGDITAKWGESTRALAVTTVIALFNWAVEEQRLAVSRVKGVRRGRFTRRECILPPDHRRRRLAACDPQSHDILTLRALTGARPFSEVANLTAAGVDLDGGLVRPAGHKTETKGERRVIVLVPEKARTDSPEVVNARWCRSRTGSCRPGARAAGRTLRPAARPLPTGQLRGSSWLLSQGVLSLFQNSRLRAMTGAGFVTPKG